MGVPRSKDLKGNHIAIRTLRVDPATFLLAHRFYLCLANSSQTLGAEVRTRMRSSFRHQVRRPSVKLVVSYHRYSVMLKLERGTMRA
jgi:hypothetical protein